MITRIQIDGFKSLLNTELYFGAFTCLVGANATGKSNFFDALMFLSKLADNTLVEAAKSVRSEDQKHADVKDIFYRSGNQFCERIYFEVDMLVAKSAEDDLGQKAEASITSLRYILELQLNDKNTQREPIEIRREELLPITQTETKSKLYFAPKAAWVESVVHGKRSTKAPFISTEENKIKLHQDGSKGRTTHFIAEKMPRTLLSTVTAESPTAFMARQEMRSWLMLQLEPSALRQPNSIYEIKNAELTAYGNNLPATLYRLHTERAEEDVYQQLTNKMKELVPAIDDIMIDNDEKRSLITLQIKFKDGVVLPAQSLSDGTLRFLGLTVLKEDTLRNTLICLEEPENGIHPKKINEIIALLEDMATDTTCEVDASNPLRQVIINSHSPLVVSKVADDSLYLATNAETYREEFGKKVTHTTFLAIADTWRTKKELCKTTSLGAINEYLGSASGSETPEQQAEAGKRVKRTVGENYARQLTVFNS